MTRHSPGSDAPTRLFPFLAWLKGYGAKAFQGDLLAGLTVAVVIIPQSMAYAMLAGLPPIHGLYAAAVAPLIAALWGSLRQLSTGPIAIMSLLVYTTLTPLAAQGSPEFIELAYALAFLVGALYLAIGLLRLGVIMAFISHSAVKGFTAAASLIIISTQLPNLLGLSVHHQEFILPTLIEIAKALPQLHWPTTLVGTAALAVIYIIRRFSRTVPAGLVSLVIAAAVVAWLELHLNGVAVVGEIPSGLLGFSLPLFDFDLMSSLLGPAVIIALVSFAETYSVGKAISAETKQKVDVDQEFVGQGLANLAVSFFQGYPVGGSFSRTAVNYAVGGKTGLSSVISSLGAAAALLFFTPLLAYIPKSALAALVISAVLALFHPREVFILWKMNRHDGIVAVTVFVLSLATKPDYALLIGVMASLMFFIWKTMHPRLVRVTKDPEANMFVNGDETGKPSCPQILHLRSDNAIYFANAEYTIEHILDRLEEVRTPVKFLLLDFNPVGFIDVTGVDELTVLKEEAAQRGTTLAFMGLHRPVRQVFESTGFLKEIDSAMIMGSKEETIVALFCRLDHDYCRNNCPHVLFHECGTVK